MNRELLKTILLILVVAAVIGTVVYFKIISKENAERIVADCDSIRCTVFSEQRAS